jgi:isochorismate pyruvate lyase
MSGPTGAQRGRFIRDYVPRGGILPFWDDYLRGAKARHLFAGQTSNPTWTVEVRRPAGTTQRAFFSQQSITAAQAAIPGNGKTSAPRSKMKEFLVNSRLSGNWRGGLVDRRLVRTSKFSYFSKAWYPVMIDPEQCLEMAEVRRGVDQVDDEIVKLLARRFRFMEAAARIKPTRDKVRDERRKAEVIDRVSGAARNTAIPDDFIVQL